MNHSSEVLCTAFKVKSCMMKWITGVQGREQEKIDRKRGRE